MLLCIINLVIELLKIENARLLQLSNEDMVNGTLLSSFTHYPFKCLVLLSSIWPNSVTKTKKRQYKLANEKCV